MSYQDIFMLGWNLNFFMFIINFLMVIFILKRKTKRQLENENETLQELKNEFDQYYPYRKYETLISYLIPFTAFFKIIYKMIEITYFFKNNKEASIYDYMIYKYKYDIQLAKNKISK